MIRVFSQMTFSQPTWAPTNYAFVHNNNFWLERECLSEVFEFHNLVCMFLWREWDAVVKIQQVGRTSNNNCRCIRAYMVLQFKKVASEINNKVQCKKVNRRPLNQSQRSCFPHCHCEFLNSKHILMTIHIKHNFCHIDFVSMMCTGAAEFCFGL